MPFKKIKGNLGFGCMRLPMTEDNQVDYSEFNLMIDEFIHAGFNYFDTAHGYLDGKSETSLRDCLVARYNREDYILANKLSSWCFDGEEDILPLFHKQLELCGVDYFDIYLFHCINHETYAKHKRCNSFDKIKALKEQGKIKHIAMSFHDTADFLDLVLTEQPFMEAVQLQINYLDYDNPSVQSKACYDVAVKHGKKVIVMEPVKGGILASVPDEASVVLKTLGDGSPASFALRYAASYPDVFMVLSGMGNMDMMRDNINTFTDFTPFTQSDFETIDRVREIILKTRQIGCTGCNYCVNVCPKNIPIPQIFSDYNRYLSNKATASTVKESIVQLQNSAADCIKCGKCEEVCSQNLEIKNLLEKIVKKLEL